MLNESARPEHLPPDLEGMNEDRARWADTAVEAFVDNTGSEPQDALPDLLCDLMHWCDRMGLDFNASLDRARSNYTDETRAA